MMNGQAASPGTVHAAAQAVTVVLTVGQGLPPPKGAPSAGGAEGVVTASRCAGHTITYGFAADRPGTITYYARYDSGRASAGLVGVSRGVEAGGRARTDAGHGLASVPRRDDKLGPAARADAGAGHALVSSRAAGRPAGIAVPLRLRPADGSRGVACVEAQLMAGCPALYFDDKEYDGGDTPLRRLLQICAAALAGICGRRDPNERRLGDGPLNVSFGGRANPHVSRDPYFSPP